MESFAASVRRAVLLGAAALCLAVMLPAAASGASFRADAEPGQQVVFEHATTYTLTLVRACGTADTVLLAQTVSVQPAATVDWVEVEAPDTVTFAQQACPSQPEQGVPVVTTFRATGNAAGRFGVAWTFAAETLDGSTATTAGQFQLTMERQASETPPERDVADVPVPQMAWTVVAALGAGAWLGRRRA